MFGSRHWTGTAEALARKRVVADLVPERFVAEELLSAFPAAPTERQGRVLLARAPSPAMCSPTDCGPRAGSWTWSRRTARHAVEPSAAQREAVAGADLVTFTSSSTVENFVAAFGVDAVPPVVACIGPITAATARQHGLSVAIEAGVHTIEGLIAAILAFSTS